VELRELADRHDEVLAEAAGITAGSWNAWPSTYVGHELVAAGMLILAGDGRGLLMDYDELERWTRAVPAEEIPESVILDAIVPGCNRFTGSPSHRERTRAAIGRVRATDRQRDLYLP
jgi:hypothetical protein